MILSASGWRKVFAQSRDEQDSTPEIGAENTTLAVIAADVFADYVREKTNEETPVIVCGTDTRPTGPAIASAVLRTLLAKKIIVRYVGIAAAPEIMAYARKFDAFIYISASHNPVGHNGIKFGLNDGGVLDADECAPLIDAFKKKCTSPNAMQNAEALLSSCPQHDAEWVYKESDGCKREALAAYNSFIRNVITGTSVAGEQESLFEKMRPSKNDSASKRLGIVCDMNGSARTCSIDRDFFAAQNIAFYAMHDKPGQIAHEIIPEGKNLDWCARELERLQNAGHADALLGYMPDCDGDRGNIVFWNETQKRADMLGAQEVFALSVLAELSYAHMLHAGDSSYKGAVAVNGPTSMRIDEIAAAFNARVFRAEVGEANVVNAANAARAQGYTVRICGEGSNGGNITYPSAVRDPMSTIFAIIKLLKIDGLYKTWCEKSHQHYNDDFTLTDILDSLPRWTTTGVADPEAMLRITTSDHAALKQKFQAIFEKEWGAKRKELEKKYGIASYEAVLTNGTTEMRGAPDFSKSGSGGLKLIFFDKGKTPCAFMWMRGSKTEPVFRIMCDVQGNDKRAREEEKALIAWERKMLEQADT
ncbi:MAG: phosphoglucomutase [Treponema sp.]|nr:phosphoglucomutase [Treponema sp.]